MFTSVADNKYLVLQKLAEAADRPETEQMQVLSCMCHLGRGEEVKFLSKV